VKDENLMLDALLNRISIPAVQLIEPAPNEEQLERILSAGLCAPDHACMRPWRFITITGDARHALGDVLASVASKYEPDLPAEKIARTKQKPLRSPLIVVIVATITNDHPKTPVVEQILSAGAAATLIQLAATAQGFGSIWLSGPNTYRQEVKDALGISADDQIIGFVYMGTPSKPAASKPRPNLENHLTQWHGPKM